MGGKNVLFLMTDEHLREASGCYGSTLVKTPTLDRIAARGTRFTNAYTPSPICVPARAALHTGRYVHQVRFWSNAQPYDGSTGSWAHRLREEGRRAVSVGKLHFRSREDDNGFDEEITPMHCLNGRGWIRGLVRDDLHWGKAHEFAEQLGPGECDYTHFDRTVCEEACRWLREEAPRCGADGWALFVSFASPHYPLIVPREYYELYPLDSLEPPRRASAEDREKQHPVVKAMRAFANYDDYLDEHTTRVAIAAYYGLCTFVDDLMGRVIGTLEDLGSLDDTTIVYTSDHGEILGNHGLWTKMVMYEEASAIPLLLAGPGIPAGASVDTPASLVDCYRTILERCGLSPSEEEQGYPGHSLAELARGARPSRTVLSEYHDGGAITGMFMIRHRQWKYVCYPGYEPELYDLAADPHEANDLGTSPEHAPIRSECETRLREVVDPEAASRLALTDQAALIEELGGRQAVLEWEDYDFTPVGA